MIGSPTDFWAKLKPFRVLPAESWLSVEDHCADVAACCEAILACGLTRRRMAHLGGLGDLSPAQVARLSFLAALHDIGKFGIGFQNKAIPKPPFTSGHVREVLALLRADAYTDLYDGILNSLPLEEMLGWGSRSETIGQLLLASICHHGRPYAAYDHFDPSNWRPYRGLVPFDGIRRLGVAALHWFPAAIDHNADPLPADAVFQHAFCGLVTLADWLGSDDRFFPFEHGTGSRIDWARRRASEVVERVGLATQHTRLHLVSRPPTFRSVFAFDPYPHQAQVTELPLDSAGSLTVLEAETGSGKTEAAIARFLRLFDANQVDGMYFALPTRTAAMQMYRRVTKCVAAAFPNADARPNVVLAVPGYIAVDDSYATRLPGFEVLWPEEDRERNRDRGWAAETPKRYMVGTVVIGTVDQLLLSALMVPHAHLRAAARLRHLLVVDEVHASDTYMARILREVLRHQLAAGGHALLMSATLGSAVREQLLNPDRPTGPPPFEHAVATPYPVVTHVPVAEDAVRIAVAGSDQAKVIGVVLAAEMSDSEVIARRALDAAATGAKVLVVRNTVAGCIDTQVALEAIAGERSLNSLLFHCSGRPAPHHSRFAKEDREALDSALETQYGKHRANAADGRVVVATQTVQQSLDIDADFMITDLCPADVLLQRLGRLHRHRARLRPVGFERPTTVILTPEDRDLGRNIRPDGEARGRHGIGTVYQDLRMIEATWRALENRRKHVAHGKMDDIEVVIPDMNRALVEEATHPEVLNTLFSPSASEWARHSQWAAGEGVATGLLAELNLIPLDLPFGEVDFPSKEVTLRVQTRLGEADRLAEFAEALVSPFGEKVRRLTIPAHLARGVPDDAVVTDVSTMDDEIRFKFGPIAYCYDRLGLRPIGNDQEAENTTDA